MGALHEGHLSLIKQAAKAAQDSDEIVVSIFVNPLQFENPEDLSKYPRQISKDSEMALAAGATRIWAPTYEEVYPSQIQKFSAGLLGDLFEGRMRPGHFDGVLTVVNRLFQIISPDVAIFGEKDFQQLFLVKQFAKSYFPDLEIWPGTLVRDFDGLALSSRNVRLSPTGREHALVISSALAEVRAIEDISTAREKLIAALANHPGFTLDYAEIIDEESFTPAGSQSRAARALVAGWVEGVRLLDNTPLVAVK
jgi:pantoate--beta-alanine ligase